MNASEPLPEFERPPVNEVAFGMLTEPVEGLLVPHFGRYWASVAAEFPRCEEAPPVLPLVELFGETASTVNLELGDGLPLPRVWLLSETGNNLIQLQRDRLLFNWRRMHPGDEYPRYPSVRAGFGRALDSFQAFLASCALKPARPLQYELTYINHIELEEGPLAEQVHAVLRDYHWDTERRLLSEADQFNSALGFLMPGNIGRLHAVARNAMHRETRRPVLLLELTARGMPETPSESAMWEWFDMTHEWIVRGFADLTEPEIQRAVWGRTT